MSSIPNSATDGFHKTNGHANGHAKISQTQLVAKCFNGCKRSGKGFMALCPAHDDSIPSLSISEGRDGAVLVHCHAGCPPKDVMHLAGLSMSVLRPDAPPPRRIVKVYEYHDAGGNLLYQNLRYEPKDFRCRRPDAEAKGGWAWDLDGAERVLYRLPQIQESAPADFVFVVEGEKDADRLASLGLVATTAVGGAKSPWLDGYTKALRKKRVVLIPDNDGPGVKKVEEIASALAGVAFSVRIPVLPDLPPKGDVSDWLDAGHTVEDLVALAHETKSEERMTAPPKAKAAVASSLRTGGKEGGKAAPTTDITDEAGRTETANARRLVKRFGDHLRYVSERGVWLVWDGCRWREDGSGIAVMGKAKEVACLLWTEVAEAKTGDKRVMASFATTSNSGRSINSTVALARCDLAVSAESLDKDGWLLNVANGTLDLRTGRLRTHDQADYLTKICPTAYEKDAPSPSWKKFLSELFAGDGVMIDYLQRLLGYGLTGDTSEQILPILWGEGGNGKSTAVEVILSVLGDEYSGAAPQELFVATKAERHPAGLMTLKGKRLMVYQETDQGARLNEALIKQLTGGDRITARGMYENFTSFSPTHKLMLSTNNKPEVRGKEHAIWRRLKLIGFEVKFEGRAEKKGLATKLKKEAKGILAWMVEGCLAWKREGGLRHPDKVAMATREYAQEQDKIGKFLEDFCEHDAEYEATAKDLYRAFKNEYPDAGVSETKFGIELGKRGFEKGHVTHGLVKGSRLWKGIRVKKE